MCSSDLESASGILNPLEEIINLARSRGIINIVDAVASVGGHKLDVDRIGIDIAVIGPQKSLAGPAGISALSVSQDAWQLIDRQDGPRDSILSLIDQKAWIDGGRAALPGTPSPMEFLALEAALDRIEAEGIDAVILRHARAAEATRGGLLALGHPPWAKAGQSSHLITTVVIPDAADPAKIVSEARRLGVELSCGVGPGAERLIRLNHTGRRASFDVVLASVAGFGIALRSSGFDADIASGAEAVSQAYQRS